MKPSWVIILGSVAIACALGLAIDLVTAHVAVEYFTVHHPKVVESREPLVMAIVWGIGASWWAGLIGGVVLAFVNSRLRPALPAKRVLVAEAKAAILIWAIMMSIVMAIYGVASVIPESERRPTFENDRRLVAVAVAHETEYALAAIATGIVAVRIWRLSRKSAVSPQL